MKVTRTPQDNTLAMQCFEYIQENIMNGAYRPGQKLKMEFLKEQLGAGQSPIREALSRLSESGLVEAEDNKGFRVASMSEEEVRDIYNVYFNIETLALEQAIKLGDDFWEASIVSTLHQLGIIENKTGPVSYADWATRNYAFHVALISGCNSPLLLELRADVYRRFDRYCRVAFNLSQTQLHLNHEEHKKLADAVLQRNFTAARELMHYHIFGALEDVIKTLKRHNLL